MSQSHYLSETFTNAVKEFSYERVGNVEMDMRDNALSEFHDEYLKRTREEDEAYKALKKLVGEEHIKPLLNYESAHNGYWCLIVDGAYKQGIRDAIALMREFF